MPCSWGGNRRSGVALALHHRLQWFIRAHGLSKGDEHPAYTPRGVRQTLPFLSVFVICLSARFKKKFFSDFCKTSRWFLHNFSGVLLGKEQWITFWELFSRIVDSVFPCDIGSHGKGQNCWKDFSYVYVAVWALLKYGVIINENLWWHLNVIGGQEICETLTFLFCTVW